MTNRGMVVMGLVALGASLVAGAAGAQGSDSTLLGFLHFRSIGPANPGGRLDGIAVATTDPSLMYLAYATGGLFKSTNRGTTFEPVFTSYGSASFGSIAIDPTNSNIVYAGTGEDNNRQSSSFGDGIYKTVDGGKTWANIGLRETQTIASVVVDPRHHDVVYVAAAGHLFGPNADRGIYKTVDGGKTWRRVLNVDENTGFTDLVMDPSNPDVLYAASYQRRRSGCCYNGGGPGSGLWKTQDAGGHWTRLTGHGLPADQMGRIALAIPQDDPRVIYAQIEAGPAGTEGGAAAEGAPAEFAGRGGYDWCNNSGAGGRGGAAPKLDPSRSGLYRSADRGATWTLMSNCDARPSYFSQVAADPHDANTVYVAGLHASVSHDGGKTFRELSRAAGMGEPTHVDIHAIWIDPRDSRHLMLATDGGLNVTFDGGETWAQPATVSVGETYWVSADMRRPYHVVTGLQDNGVWGGPSGTRSADGAILNAHWYGIRQNDGFHTAVDPSNYNIVYGESQDGGAVRYDLATGDTTSVRPVAPRVAGAGVQASAEASGSRCVDGRIIAGGATARGRGRGNANPRANVINAQPGEAYRFNWNTPIMLSPNDPNIFWIGGNRLFKSNDRGDTYTESADLTKNMDRCQVRVMGVPGNESQLSKNDGITSYSTIISISESPVTPGVVWAGTDDGNVQVSRDGGMHFTEVGRNIAGLPAGALAGDDPYWISSIEASHFDSATAYVAVDGHRTDDLHPYIFVTHDLGRTFQRVTGDLPSSDNVQVIREDPKNPRLLYVGTEFGMFISLDAGATWNRARGGFPTVRTDDILIHPRDGDIIVATHGRGIWIGDDITPLQQFGERERSADPHLFDVRPAVAYRRDYEADQCRPTLPCLGQAVFAGENAPAGTAISYYVPSSAAGTARVTVTDISGRTVCESQVSASAGINRVQWTLSDFRRGAPAGRRGGASGTAAGRCDGSSGAATAPPGEYTVTLSVGGHEDRRVVQVLEDRWIGER